MEMRDMDVEWTFKLYRARDDSAYNEYLIQIDDHRIKVINMLQ